LKRKHLQNFEMLLAFWKKNWQFLHQLATILGLDSKWKWICIPYCHEVMKSSLIYAIVTDEAGVQPVDCRLGPRQRAQTCG